MSEVPADPITGEPITPEEAAAQFGLPIEHLFDIDPLEITSDDLLLLAQHYRATRFNFMKLQEKPKAVDKSRGPKLTAEQTQAQVDSILNDLFGD